MVIIQLAGGLGNQMFQYALYLKLRSLGKEVKIDDASGFLEDAQRIPALAPFGVSYERPCAKELRQMLDSSPLPWHRVRRKLFGRHKKSYFEESKLFIPDVMNWDDIYLEGYWQSEKYFRDVEEEVRAAYDMDRLIDYLWQTGLGGQGKSVFEKYFEDMERAVSVSVHIRGGDYLTPENQALFGGICTDAYYIEGIRQMRERHPGCKFFLFTNDKAWAKGQLVKEQNHITGDWLKDATWVELPETENKDYAEFVLMARCRHHILANSSFSWWASYLNNNPGKTVLAPGRWLNHTDCSDIYRADMQQIPI